MSIKSIFLKILTVLLLAVSSIALYSCNGDEPEKQHKHTLSYFEEKTPSCQEDGHTEYWICSECGKMFSDENANSEIKDSLIPAAHNFVGGKCSICGEKKTSQELLYSKLNWLEAYEVSGIDDSREREVIIPEFYNGLPVIGIADNAFRNCSDIISISLPHGITYIGSYAFWYCINLSSITVPDTVSFIGDYTFSGCARLAEVNLSEKSRLEAIGDYAFDGCMALSSIIIPENVLSIGYGAFSYCTKLKSAVFQSSDNLNSIGAYAFDACESLTEISIPESVSVLKHGCFRNCTGLEAVSFGKASALKSIGDFVFYNCTSLKSISIPAGTERLGAAAFQNCTKIDEICFLEDSGWYMTRNYNDYTSKSNGTEKDLSNSRENADNFTSTFVEYYWYKI